MTLLNRADSWMPMTSRMRDEPDDDHGRHVQHGAGVPGPALGEDPPDVQPGVRHRGVGVGRRGVGRAGG